MSLLCIFNKMHPTYTPVRTPSYASYQYGSSTDIIACSSALIDPPKYRGVMQNMGDRQGDEL